MDGTQRYLTVFRSCPPQNVLDTGRHFLIWRIIDQFNYEPVPRFENLIYSKRLASLAACHEHKLPAVNVMYLLFGR
jgi:hypothetical protein